jgi:hypothetical protein
VVLDPARVEERERDQARHVGEASDKEERQGLPGDRLDGHPARRNAHAPRASPPAPLTDITEFAPLFGHADLVAKPTTQS